ncbi:SxtJ family membrane protein [Rhodohalobacter sp. 614A]|uniref:SxtJ family membrane protein n=1 Tax=Rhodohalobacter sp. 614A TaxID=2908649 RepID=UPI001F278E9D|nr:SxtJ family membrane protein [Rhodohalobacter sp. 614A]
MVKDKSKSTVLIISMGFLLIYFFSDARVFLYISLVVGLLGLSDYLSQIIEKLWMGLSKLLSYIVPNILLTIVFYVILLPFALIHRLTENDPMLLSSDHDTYWVHDEKELDPKSFEKTW